MPDKTVALDRKVPDFSLPASGGKPWKLSALSGRNVVIYFYPRDNTSGCTQEGIDFRDLYAQFRKAKTEVVGVSTDTLASHEKFASKYEFPFQLLSDESQKACQLFDVIKEKSMQRVLIALGGVLVLAGVFWPWLAKLPLGRLPGDIVLDRPGLKVFAPFTTMIVLSLALSALVWLFRR